MRHFLVGSLIVALTGCPDSDSDDNSADVGDDAGTSGSGEDEATADEEGSAGDGSEGFGGNIGGQVQKGPFVNGSEITIAELDDGLTQTGRTFSANIVDDTGSFSVAGAELATSFARIGADGFYYNEVTGQLSDSRLSLFAYADLSSGTTVNVNLLGHLEAGRIAYLVQDQGLSFADARAQAHREVLGVFSFDAEDVDAAETLDISQGGAGNAKLLAMSAILQGTRSVAELTELLSNIQTDIRTDGVLDSETSGSALINGAQTVNWIAVREDLQARYEALGVVAEIPDFENHLQHFVDNADYEFTGGITYPEGGERPNVLALGVTEFQSEVQWPRLGFLAELPPTTELTIVMTQTGGGNEQNAWSYQGTGANWSATLWDGSGVQSFTAAHDGTVDYEAFDFHGTGSATVDYYEYGSKTPTRTKEISWSPAGGGGDGDPPDDGM